MGRHILIFIVLFIGMPQAMAEFVFSPSLSLTQSSLDKSYTKQKTTTTSTDGTTSDPVEEDITESLKTSASTTSINLAIGWALNNWLFLGAKVLSESGSGADPTTIPLGSDSDSQSSTTVSTAATGFGLAFGFLPNENFNLLISYLVSMSRTQDIETTSSDGDTTQKFSFEETGTGLMVDIGYRFRMGAFGMGPMLVYKSLSFADEKVTYTLTSGGSEAKAEAEFTNTTTETSLSPYLGFWFQF